MSNEKKPITFLDKMALYQQEQKKEEAKAKSKEQMKEGIVELELSMLLPFKNQPFKPYTEEEMKDIKESIERIGLQNAIIVRAIENGKFEILAGHNRVQAFKELGMKEIPSRIVEVDDDTAQMIMIDTNIVQRESLSIMERAKAYKLKQEIKERKGYQDYETKKVLTEDENKELEEAESRRTFERYLSLNNLIPEYQNQCENGSLSATAGEHLSKLNPKQQKEIYKTLRDSKISTNKARQLKELAQEQKEFSEEMIKEVFSGNKNTIKTSVRFTKKEMEKYFSECKSVEEMKEKIIKALEKAEQKT